MHLRERATRYNKPVSPHYDVRERAKPSSECAYRRDDDDEDDDEGSLWR